MYIFEKKDHQPETIWATVNIWYIAPKHQFLKSVLSFLRFWYISKCSRFLKSLIIIVFQAPAQFQKNEDVSNTTLY